MIIDGLFDYLSNFLITLINALLYPVTKLFSELYSIIDYIFSTIYNLFASFLNLLNTIYLYFSDFLYMFPDTWSFIILSAIVVMFLLRIYNLLWGGNEG